MTNSMEMGSLGQNEEKGGRETAASIFEKLSHNVETYEDFLKENALLEAFVDDIEKNAPNGKADTYSKEFWEYYAGYVEKKMKEEYEPIVTEEMENEDLIVDYIFSGGTTGFGSAEHFVRLKQRTALHMTKEALNLDEETTELLKKTFPLYDFARTGNTVPRVEQAVLDKSTEDTQAAKEELKNNPRFEEIQYFNTTTLKIFNTMYGRVRTKFMHYGTKDGYNFEEQEKAEEIANRHNHDYRSKAFVRDIADVINQDFDMKRSGIIRLLGPDELSVVFSDDEKDKAVVKNIIEGATEVSYLNSAGMSKIWDDSEGYCWVMLSV